METRYINYANAIVHDMLGLRLGDALSINTGEEDLGFARLIADTAVGVTDVTVKVVVIDDGRPASVLEFDPSPPAHMPDGFAMLRLSHEKSGSSASSVGHVLDVLVDRDDLATLQRLGNLAEPLVLDRRISVPWAVAKVFDGDDEAWTAIDRTISLNIPNQTLSLRYRRESLEKSRIREMTFENGDSSFSVEIPAGSVSTCGLHSLGNGREFLSTIDFDRMNFLADRCSAQGYFTADVKALGRKQTAKFTFKDGLLVDWTHTPQLDALIGFDCGMRRVGYISMRDNEFFINLGGALVETLADAPDDESGLPDFFNTSLYTLRCALARDTTVVAADSNGICRILAKDGVFVE